MRHTPRISNLSFFTEATLDIDGMVTEVERKINAKIDKTAYESFATKKFRKPVFDLYALFSPFNEANKAFYPFIPYLKKTLKKGDIILDFGSRTGWSTAMLSALFSEQKIISTWEGDTDALGYSGFNYWFGAEDTNIEIFFCNKNEPLPIADKSIAFVYALDVLHRHIKTDLINELMRVVKNDALIVFPHVHLSNAQPEPYFVRGGDLLHGLAYEKFLARLNNKKGYVFSEPELFKASYSKDYRASANPNTSNYNGLVAIVNRDFDLEEKLSVFNYFDYFNTEEGYLLPNAIFELDVNNAIKLRTSQIETPLLQLMAHHPVYLERIKNTIGYVLSDDERIVLYWAKKCRSCSFIQNQLKTDSGKLQQIIEKLEGMDILQIMPLNEKHARMQHYFAYQEYLEGPETLNLRSQWKRSAAKFEDNTYILDRNDYSFFTYREFDEIVKYITSTLIQSGIGKGDKIILHSDINFEAIALFWACMHLGIIFIPLSSSVTEIVFEGLIEKYKPKVIFLYHDTGFRKKWNDSVVFFDRDGKEDIISADKLFFSAWLRESHEIENLPDINENDLAVILHTSGSTGVPKGVKLAHGQLVQSAINLVNTFYWDETNKYLSINDMDSIAGLRSACVTTVEAGGTCIIPSVAEKSNPAKLLECIYETDTTCISTGPSLLNQFLSRKDVKARLASIKYIISAGSALTTQLKTEFFEKTNKRISNIYGLTETAGIAVGEPSDSTHSDGNYIGFPVDCIIKIVDEDDKEVKVGEIGELILYGYTIFKGYYSSNEPLANETQQWFATGDLVRKNSDGSIDLTDRKKDFMKNARGEIVYFSEIEDALAPLPFIKDLGVIAFFKDEAERGALFIVLDDNLPPPKNLVEEIKKQITITIGSNKIPSFIKTIDEIPRNKYGKLLKSDLATYL